MIRKRFLCVCLVLVVFLSGAVTVLFQPTAAVAASPATPTNLSPLDGATDVSLTPTLQSSAFSDPDARDTHTASQWQIRTSSGDYSSPLFDSGKDSTNLISITVPSGTLAHFTTYYWHVMHHDKRSWSRWSPETSFVTARDITAPVLFSVAATNITGTDAMITWTTDEPASSQVEYGLTTGYGSTSTLYTNLVTSHSVNLTDLTPGTTYHYRVISADVWGNQAQSGDYTFTTERVPVTFADTNLEAAIRGAIGKPTGPIYQSDLDALVTLNASSSGIKKLTGLEHCTCLTWLDLTNNQIGDISPLSGLTSLRTLRLWSNQTSDISPLAGLTSLIYLYLHNNQISDILPLAGLTKLTTLNLHDNQISDISPLSGLTNLTWLELYDNQISDISPLAGLTSLTEVRLWSNQISDISPLAGLSSLTTLRLFSNQIGDISPLAGLTNLAALALYDNQIGDISPLSGLTNLTELWLGLNQISDISPLAGLTSLTTLNLHDNQVSDISPLVHNPGIASGDTVYLNRNPLSDTSLYEYIPSLEDRGVEVYWNQDGQPPSQPSNVSPEDVATGVSITPTLRSSVFSDPDGDTPAASWWQITTTAGDYSSPVFDSGRDTTHLTSIVAPALNCSTVYYWRVRYQDNRGVWSDWSTEASFTTSAQDAGDGEGDGDSSLDGFGNGEGGTSPAASNKGGLPFWVWIVVGVGALAVFGGGILTWRRTAKKPMAAG
jgi:Leucine-rich repeat (LRR) protein